MPNHNGDYEYTTRLGDIGEDFVYRHFQDLLLPGQQLLSIATKGELETEGHTKDEGGDFFVAVADTSLLVCVAQNYGVEVKTQQSMIPRNNDGHREWGSLGFDLWENSSRARKGGFIRMMAVLDSINESQLGIFGSFAEATASHEAAYGENTTKGVAYKTVLPGYLVFALVDGQQKPFACIVFRDFLALSKRMKQLARKAGFELDPVNFPTGEAAALLLNRASITMCNTKNTWYVDLYDLKDLADVYLVNNPSDVTEETKGRYTTAEYARRGFVETVALQNLRLQHLRELANGKVIIDKEA